MGRVYATAADYQTYSGQTPPADIDRQLARASELLDSEVLLPAWYDIDANSMPTNAEVIEAFAKATCAQVEFWGEVGEEVDLSGPIQGARIGTVTLQYGAGGNRTGPEYIGPRVFRALSVLPRKVFQPVITSGWVGGWW